ncbi:MAG: TonB-dependent receptor [Alteromonadaceae bacterium]|nr:TonB-dependent receptor [Alteromonadaceae bacterium]
MTNTNYPKAIRRCKKLPYLLPALLVCSTTTWANEPAVDSSDFSFDSQLPMLGDDIPEVLTTTRLRQPKTRVPGSTTVIEGDTIRDLGILNLYEVFRLVPGMTVNFVGSHQPSVTYHGTSQYEQRRMQVLVDGRTAHRATLSDMDWKTMPVPLEMIERIEVARGPNAAAYGINAFLGTINIITRDPADTAGIETHVSGGSRGHRRAFGSVGSVSETMDWRLTYEKRKFDGFDVNEDGEDFHDGKDINAFNWDSRLYLNNAADLELRAGIVDGVDERDQDKGGSLEPVENPDIELRDYHLQAKLNYRLSNNHFFHVQAAVENYKRQQEYGIAWGETAAECLEDGTPLYSVDSAGDDICFLNDEAKSFFADINDSYEDTRIELELQDTLLFSDDLKLVTGTGFRKDILRSQTFFNGREEVYQSRIFGNLEYTPWHWLTLNAGGNWERTSTTGDDYFSPRVAANFQLTEQQALRFVFSKAVRTPDAFEQNRDYGYTLANVRSEDYPELEGSRVGIDEALKAPNAENTMDQQLEEERITSYEISYFTQYSMDSALLSLEVRGFRDEMRDMIGGIIQLKEWSLENEYQIDQKGFELEASAEFPGTTMRASYAYLDQDTSYTGALDKDQSHILERMSVRHSGSLAVVQDLPWQMKAATTFYWADEFNRQQEQFERIDIRLAKQFFGPRHNAELAFIMQHYLNRQPELSSDNVIEDHNQYFVEASLKF